MIKKPWWHYLKPVSNPEWADEVRWYTPMLGIYLNKFVMFKKIKLSYWFDAFGYRVWLIKKTNQQEIK